MPVKRPPPDEWLQHLRQLVREVDHTFADSRYFRPAIRWISPPVAPPRRISLGRLGRLTHAPLVEKQEPDPVQQRFKDRVFLVPNDLYFETARQLFHKLVSDRTIHRSWRSHLGAGGPRVLSPEQRVARGTPAPVDRDLPSYMLSLLTLDFDDELRARRRPLSRAQRRFVAAGLRAEERARATVPEKWRRPLCAAVYLLVVAALVTVEIWRRASVTPVKFGKQVEQLIDELVFTTTWLYGKPLVRVICTIVRVAMEGAKPSPATWQTRPRRRSDPCHRQLD
jgi:hypothetical protein